MGIIADFILSQAKSRIFTPQFSDDSTQIEGLRHDGVSWQIRRALTDFGSGYQGPKHPSFEEGLIGPGSAVPPPKQPNLTFQWLEQGFVRHEKEDFAEELPFYLLPEIEKKIVPRETILPFLKKNWKIATAVGLVGLYMTKPLSLFSGRDDESNTLEGLRHGGLSQRMRRDMTPFGSGWDPMRALAKEAGLSLEKFVAQPHMKLAMASGDVVRELGQGSFGKVHLMESTVRIGEKEHTFQYARKSVFDNSDRLDIFHEVKAQRKLQDLNAPSVYGWSGNQIYMESIHGESAYQIMKQGGDLPRSFIEDMEKFVPEMHRRGIAHMDMARDVNRLLDIPGKGGEVLPHNIMVTPEGRAAVLDYGMSMKSGSAGPDVQSLHQLYAREKFSTNAELDMSLVKSLRKNDGALSADSFVKFNTQRRSTPIVAPPSAKTIRAKIRTNTQSVATKKTAKEMFRVGSGRKSRSVFASTNKV